jgi:GT2 family glycosyltransferase
MTTAIGLSVIVPTHDGRESMVMRLIDTYTDARHHATLPSELIVVDSATGRLSEDLAAYCTKHQVRYQRGPKPAGTKRNLGVAVAAYDAVLFIDSDCMLTPVTLREHERIFELGEDVGAVTGPTDLEGPITPLWRVLEWSGMYSRCFDHARQYEQVSWGVTANICVRRAAFERINGFDEDIVTPVGGEDVDFGTRLSDAGFLIRTNPHAIVKHAREHVTVRHVARSMLTYGRADSYLCQQHPERTESYLDPFAVGVLAFGAGRLVGRRPTAALAWAVAAWSAAAAKRQTDQPYTPAEQGRKSAGVTDLARRAAAGVLDSCFDVGRLAEGVRANRLDLFAKRFRYVDPAHFIPRRDGVARQEATDVPHA